MGYQVIPFTAQHARAAAEIHAEGQPGTFLTSLWPTFLRALYAEMAASPRCYGFVALESDEVIGVVVGATDASAIFKELIVRRGVKLALPVLGAMLRHLALLSRVVETLRYPTQQPHEPGEAELFYIGVRSARRGAGVGAALFDALARASRQRGMRAMGLIVDDANETAKRFYLSRGMAAVSAWPMYGRLMNWYRLDLENLPQ